MTMEELLIVLEVNNKQLIEGLSQAKEKLNDFNKSTNKSTTSIFSSFKKLGVMIAGLGIGKLIANSINDGIESIESEGRFGVLFKGYSEEMRTWSQDLQKSLGINEYSARSTASSFFELATAQGISADSAKEMAKNLTMVGYDVASFKDKDLSQVMNAMQSAFVGNTEALRSMGYVITADMVKQEAYKKGIAKTGSQLTQTQKAMATYSLVMEQTSAAQGDLARTISSPSNQLRILKDSLKQLSIEFGKAFTPILTYILPILNAFVQKLIQAAKVFTQFMQAIFGKSPSSSGGGGTAGATSDLVDLGGAYDDVADSAKKASKSVLSFDEVNTLSNPADSSSIDTSVPSLDFDSSGDDIDTETIPAKIQEIADKIKAKLEAFRDWFVKYKDVIIAVVGGIIAGFVAFKTLTFLSQIPAMFTAIGTALAVLTSPIGIAAVAIGALAAIFIYLWRTNEEFRDNMIEVWERIKGVFEDFNNNTLKPFADSFYNGFLKPIADAFGTYLLPIFADLFVQLGNALAVVFELISGTLHIILDAISPVINLIADLFAVAAKYIYEVWNEHLKGLVDKVIEYLSQFINAAVEIYDKFIGPLIHWCQDLLAPIIIAAFDAICSQLKILLGVVFDVIGGIFDICSGLIDFVMGIFTGDWERAWGGIQKIFEGVWTIITSIVNGFIEYIVNGFTKMYELVKLVIETLAKAIGDVFSWIFNYVIETCTNLYNGIVDSWDEMGQYIGGILTTMGEAIANTWNDFVTIISDACESIYEYVSTVWNETYDYLSNVLSNIGKAISDTWNDIINFLGGILGNIVQSVQNNWNAIYNFLSNILGKVFQSVKDNWNNIVNFLTNIFNNILQSVQNNWNSIINFITNALSKIVQSIQNNWNNIVNFISNVLNKILQFVKDTWNNIYNFLSNILYNIYNFIKNIWNNIYNFFSNILNSIKNVFSNAWNGISSTTSNVLNGVSNIVSNVFNGIKNTMSNIASYIGNGFKNAWSNAWRSVVNVFNNIWQGLTSFVKTPLNFIIDMVNKVIDGLNRIKLPSWVPGIGGYGINISNIPRLAKGGIVDKPTIAQIGEAGPEMVVPLKNTDFVTKMANAVGAAVYANLSNNDYNNNDVTSNQPIILRVGEMDFGKAAINAINKVTKVNGQCLLRT